MKTWKCPHCARIEQSKDDVIMVLCPTCINVNMEEVFVEQKLRTEKPEDFKGINKRLCLRCGKVPAVEGKMYCEKGIKEREQIDENIRVMEKLKQEKKEKK